jgi:hypothetical protein
VALAQLNPDKLIPVKFSMTGKDVLKRSFLKEIFNTILEHIFKVPQ